MIDWIGSQRRYHVVVDGRSACGAPIGGETVAELPCDHCLGLLFGALESVPGLDAEEA